MASSMKLTEEQRAYVECEGHHNGDRYVIVLVDRQTGEVMMDWKSEILRMKDDGDIEEIVDSILGKQEEVEDLPEG